MSENNSSAVHKSIMPGSKFTTSTISDNSKTGEFGDMPISVSAGDSTSSTEKAVSSEAFGTKSDTSFGAKEAMPQGKPSSSFINTSAVK